MTRTRCLSGVLAGLLCGLAVLGTDGGRAAAPPAPTVSVTRLSNLAFQIWPGDFNGDGITDLAGTVPPAPGAATAPVRVLLGNGSGGFPTAKDTTYFGRVL